MPHVPLNALRTFEAVASRLSFKEGAAALNVSPAAVSSQIRLLEERINQPLFNRNGRSIELTEAGRLLLPGVQRGMAELRAAMKALEENLCEGVLNVSMVPIFLQKWMMPRLNRFYRVAPEIELRISADNAPVNFDESDMHAAIRFGPGEWPGVNAVKLMNDWILPVCSPDYLQEIGPIESMEDLQRYHLLYDEGSIWEAWYRGTGLDTESQRLPRLNDGLSILLAAEHGQGIALSSWSIAARDIAAGRLVRPFKRLVPTDWCYYFVAPEAYFDMPKVAIFRDWMIELCASFEKPS